MTHFFLTQISMMETNEKVRIKLKNMKMIVTLDAG